MIQQHEFNTAWYGQAVGSVCAVEFFSLPRKQQQAALGEFAWVEFRAPLESTPPLGALHAAGFYQVDTQLPFHIDFNSIQPDHNTARLTLARAEARPFELHAEQFVTFASERFRFLPDMTTDKLNQRYALWGNRLIASHPHYCCEIALGTQVQGWFLSKPHADQPEQNLELCLNMLHRDAHISGASLYRKAYCHYANTAKTGAASFSVTNTAALNIYADLGAHFYKPIGYWIKVC